VQKLFGFCTTIAKNLRRLRKCSVSPNLTDSDFTRAKAPSTPSSDLLSFRPPREIFLRSFALARDDGHRPVTFAPFAFFARDNPRLTGARSAPYENLRVLRAFVVNPAFLILVVASPCSVIYRCFRTVNATRLWPANERLRSADGRSCFASGRRSLPAARCRLENL
jgi:hypothetical protein